MKVIGYARVVPGEGGETALKHQREQLEAYCASHSLQLAEFFSEEISGDTSLEQGRLKLKEAISACNPGDTLLVVRLDRLSSQRKLLTEIFEHCQGKSIKVTASRGAQSPEEVKNSLEVTVQAG